MAANAGTIQAELLLNNQQFMNAMNEAMQEMNHLQHQSNNVKRANHQVAGALAGVGAGIVAAVGASVVTAARFEQSMAKVKAISGATDSDFAKLEQTAKDLGASTAFSATEAADGMGLLAAAGFKTNEIIASMPGLLNLAGAAQVDLASSADWLGSIMAGFGIDATESAHSVDVLVKAMNDANTDLPDMAEAMKYVAPVASSLKIGMEDTAAAVALMSNYGIKGSQAGTTLRASLLALANPVGQGKKMMKELGLSVKDSNGEMLSLPKMIDAISESLEGKTEADRVSAAAALVGTEASSGFLALLNEGGDTIEEFSRKLENSDGAAEAFAATMKDTLAGAWDNLTSSIEGVGINLGESFMPEAKAVVGIMQNIVDVVSELDPDLIELTLKIAGGAAAAGLLYSALGKIPLAFKALQIAMGPTGWLMLGLGALAGAFMSVGDGAEDMSTKILAELDEMAKQNRTLEETADRFDFLKGKMKLTTDQFGEYIDLNQRLGTTKSSSELEKIKDAMEKLQKSSGLSKDELDELVGINQELAETVPDANNAITDQNNIVVEGTEAVRKYTKAKRDELLLELEIKKAKAEADEKKNLSEQKQINSEMKDLNKELAGIEKDILDTSKKITKEKEAEKKAREENQVGAANIHKQEQELAEFQLNNIQKQKVKVQEKLLAKQKEGAEIEKELGLLDTVDQQMANIILSQVGLNGKKEEGIDLINEEIVENNKALSKIDEKAKKEKLTKEQAQALVDQYLRQNDELLNAKQLLQDHLGIKDKDAKMIKEQEKALKGLQDALKKQGYELDLNTGKVTKMKDEAEKTNKELEKDVKKEVKTDDKGSNAKNHKEATKKGEKNVETKDKGSNSKNHKDATKKGEKEVKANDKGSNDKNHKDATKKGDKQVETKDKGSNDKNHKDATKSGEKTVKTENKGSNEKNHKDATKSGTKTVKVDDKGTNSKNHSTATKAGTKSITAKLINLAEFMSNFSPVTMTVKASASLIGSAWDKISGKKHGGGTVHELPKFHEGGSPSLRSLGFSAPKFDEVDVRLLRNEMVLTQGQQSNLFRMISTFGSVAAGNLKKATVGEAVAKTTIQVGQMVVREEADVKRIAEELDRLATQRQRARGEY